MYTMSNVAVDDQYITCSGAVTGHAEPSPGEVDCVTLHGTQTHKI